MLPRRYTQRHKSWQNNEPQRHRDRRAVPGLPGSTRAGVTAFLLCDTNPRLLVFWKRIFGFLCALIGTPTDADRRRHHGQVGVCQRPSAYPISSIPFRNLVAFCLVAAAGRARSSVLTCRSFPKRNGFFEPQRHRDTEGHRVHLEARPRACVIINFSLWPSVSLCLCGSNQL